MSIGSTASQHAAKAIRRRLVTPTQAVRAARGKLALGNATRHPANPYALYDLAALNYRSALSAATDTRTSLAIAKDAMARGSHGTLRSYNGYRDNRVIATGKAGFAQALAQAKTKQEAMLVREEARVFDHRHWSNHFGDLRLEAWRRAQTLPDEQSLLTRFTIGLRIYWLERR